MDLESIVVTGANRGIGFEFVSQLVHLPNPPKYVFTTYKSESTIQELKRIQTEAQISEVILIKMDVTNIDEIRAAKRTIEEKLGDNGLTLLINNAGAADDVPFPDLTEENMIFHYLPNSVGPVLVFQELLPLLQKAADRKSSGPGLRMSRAGVLNISSGLGSLTTTTGTHPNEMLEAFAYKMSKAALNMAMRIIAVELQDTGILVVMMCPGWVKTDMGTDAADLEISDSISAMMKTLGELNDQHHGSFIDRHGKTIPF